jgi:hypothetical protein
MSFVKKICLWQNDDDDDDDEDDWGNYLGTLLWVLKVMVMSK